MKKKFRARWLPLILGALLSAYALAALLCAQDRWIYAICAPNVRKPAATDAQGGDTAAAETGLEALVQQRDAVAERLGDEARVVSCSGRTLEAEIRAERDFDGRIGLYAVDVCWLEAYPQRILQGHWMDNSELRAGARVAVLDQNTAFALFGSESCVGSRFKIDDVEYRVVGVTARRAGLGEAAENYVYIPLLAAADQGMQLESLEMTALPANGKNLGMNFKGAMQEAWGKGSFYCVRREVMAQTMLPRWMVVFAGMALFFSAAGAYRRRVAQRIAEIREMCEKRYLIQVLGQVLLRVLRLVLGAAALLGMLYVLLVFALHPVYTFTEWVPESLVELSKYSAVFWNLAREASGAVTVQTAEIARLHLLGRFLNWGCSAILLSLAAQRVRMPRRLNAK